MTGNGHRWTGIGAAFFAAAITRVIGFEDGVLTELIAGVMAAVSCRVPDSIEFPIYKNGMRTGTLIKHRTLTHWPPLWLLIMAWGCHDGTYFGAMAVGVAMGAMTHIFGDAPNPMGIPWFWPTKRLSLGKKGLWRSGQWEPAIILVYSTAGYYTWRLAGGEVPELLAFLPH